MKKPIKYALIGLIILAIAAGSIYYMMLPLPVRMTQIIPQAAELSFTEQGIVAAESTILVFSAAQGELNNLYAQEGQQVQAGDALLSVDDTSLRLRLDQVQSGIRSLEAQLANVDVEDASMRRNLLSARGSLQGELQAINAQAAQSDLALVNQTEALNEQMRIQQVLIDQHKSELNRIQENFNRVETLHHSGVATLSEFETALSAVTAAETQLEAAYGQMAVIASGIGISSAEHFEGIRTSINAQVYGINQQLAQDTTTAARAHFEALIAVEEANAAQILREIENAVVTAPAGGIVTILHAQNTNFVSAAAPVAEITVPGSLFVEVYVSTQDVNGIKIGDRVRLTLRQRTGDIWDWGTVSKIDTTAVVRLSALGIEERKVRVFIARDSPPDTPWLGIGFAVDVTFYVYREENRITVPRTAIFRVDGQDMVWRVQGYSGPVNPVLVETGMELRTDVVIESGLIEGDFVVNDANNQDLQSGVRVIHER